METLLSRSPPSSRTDRTPVRFVGYQQSSRFQSAHSAVRSPVIIMGDAAQSEPGSPQAHHHLKTDDAKASESEMSDPAGRT